MKTVRSEAPDIFHFEKKFREMIHEVERNTKELDKLEKEHLLIRKELYFKELLWQDEQSKSHDLGIRLKSAMETIKRLEEEKMRDKIAYSNLSTNYDSVLRERDFLAKKVLSSQTMVTSFKIKIEELENTLRRESREKQKLERALMELKIANEKIVAHIDMIIVKMLKEQKYLLDKSRAVIQLNKRLQMFSLCFHAINEKNRAEIKHLQQKLIAASTTESKLLPSNDKLYPAIKNLCFKLEDMLKEFKSKAQNSALVDENLSKMIDELIYTYKSTNVKETNN